MKEKEGALERLSEGERGSSREIECSKEKEGALERLSEGERGSSRETERLSVQRRKREL